MSISWRETRSWSLALVVGLLAALATILPGTTASASAVGVGETRVGAFNVVGEVPVGPPEHVSAGQRRDAAEISHQIVVATGVAANGVPGRIPARDVRFTQDSVGPTFKNGEGVLDAGEDWAAAGRAPNWMDADPIRLFRENGNVYSLDNRRLLAGQYADVDLPYRWATPGEIATRTRTEIFGGTSTMVRFRGAYRGDTSNWAWWQR